MACIYTLENNKGETLIFKTDEELLQFLNENPEYITGKFVEGQEVEESTIETQEQQTQHTIQEKLNQEAEKIEREEASLPVGNITNEVLYEMLGSIDNIEGVTLLEEFTVANYVFNYLSETLKENKKVDKAETIQNIRIILTEIFSSLVKDLNNTIKDKKLKNLDTTKEELELLKMQVALENIDRFIDKGTKRLLRYTQVENLFEESEEENQQDENYSKESFEEKGKKTGSYPLKRFYAGIKRYDGQGNVVTGFAGLPMYTGFDTIDNTIKNVLTSPVMTAPNLEVMLAKLETFAKTYTWIPEFVEKMRKADGQMKNAFVTENSRQNYTSKFVMFKKITHQEAGMTEYSYSMKVMDTNSKDIARMIKSEWTNNFLTNNSGLVKYESKKGEYFISLVKVKELLALLKTFDSNTKDVDIMSFLDNFGLNISEKTLAEMKDKKILGIKDDGVYIGAQSTVIGLLGKYLEKMSANTEDVTLSASDYNNPLYDMGGALKTLANIEQKHSSYAFTTSLRDGDKSIWTKPLSNAAKDLSDALLTNEALRESFRAKAFNGTSSFLELLEDPEFRNIFGIEYQAIQSLKESGVKDQDIRQFTQMSLADMELTQLGHFQDLKKAKLKITKLNGYNFVLREAGYSLQTNSDKSQSLILNGYAIKLSEFSLGAEGIQGELVDYLFGQLVLPELNRIIDFNNRNRQTDIADYDSAAGYFLGMPGINELKYGKLSVANCITPQAGKNLEEEIARIKAILTQGHPFRTYLENAAKGYLVSFMKTAVANKVSFWENNLKVGGQLAFNQDYLNELPKIEGLSKTEVAAYDFIVNDMVAKANASMLFIGDPALFVQGRKFIGMLGVDLNVANFQKAVENTVGSNQNKRLAGLIAPRNKISGANEETYIQLALEDFKDMSSNMEYLVTSQYGEQERAVISTYIKNYKEAKSSSDKKVVLEKISSAYPNVIDYLENTATDAQEITTELEHVKFMYNQGYMNEELYNTVRGKILARIEAEVNSKELPKEQALTKEEIEFIYQPIKPVHTGFKDDVTNGIMRTMYVKTSSYPLRPNLTVPFQIDELRKALEKFEYQSGIDSTGKFNPDKVKSVRASFQTGNKVGAPKKGMPVVDSNGNIRQDISLEEMKKSSVEISRNNIGIQQDVPVKFKKGEEKVSLGTQVLKLLFGAGVSEIKEGFFYAGKPYSGKALMEEFNAKYVEYAKLLEKKLYTSLGFSGSGDTINSLTSLKKLQNLIYQEAESRDFPTQVLESLELYGNFTFNFKGIEKSYRLSIKDFEFLMDIKDKKIRRTQEVKDKVRRLIDEDVTILDRKTLDYSISEHGFNIPIWLAPNSNKLESLLNAMVSNKLTRIKLPGAAFVVGSETGYKMKVSSVQAIPSNVIFTESWTGELKAAELNKDGSVKKAQVLLPLRLRNNKGEIIQFFDENNKPNPKYVKVDESGRMTLIKGMIDEELLSSVSFRIPTSSHVSMATIEVVGILPISSGDLMIVPKNFTTQKGLDFDVDKENMYRLHTYMDSEGKVKVLTESTKKEIQKQINTLEEEIQKGKDLASLVEVMPEDIKQYVSGILETLGSDEEATLEGLKEVMQEDITKKLLENDLVKIHTSVLSHPKVQEKMNTPLSMDVAKESIKLIEGATGNVSSQFSLYSNEYYNNLTKLGAVGKMGISSYSNFVTLAGQLQQLENKPVITEYDSEAQAYRNLIVVIGDMKSEGVIGENETIKPDNISQAEWDSMKRTVSKVFEERQNTATDNAKEGIMGAANIGEETISVDCLLALLGFDLTTIVTKEGKTEKINIGYLLMSQPVIRDYVALQDKNGSLVKGDSYKAEEEFNKKYELDVESLNPAMLTGQALYNSLSNPNHEVQANALAVFFQLRKFADELVKLNSKLNITSSGLGKSFIETVDKYDFFANNGLNTSSIRGFSQLVGKVKVLENQEDIEKASQDPNTYIFYSIDKIVAYTPTTPLGITLISAIHTNRELWDTQFIQHTNAYKDLEAELIDVLKLRDNVDNKHLIFEEFKKFLITSPTLGIFKKGENLSLERYRLAVDNDNKASIVTYLRDLKNSGEFPEVFTNALISSLNLTHINRDSFSFLEYNNAKQEDFDEIALYQALVELAQQNKALPTFNGKEYSTRELVTDLIKYTYLQGGAQKAIEFSKYIPVSYLRAVGFTKGITILDKHIRTKGISNAAKAEFIQQFIRNNPKAIKVEKAKTLNDKDSVLSRNPNWDKQFSKITWFVPVKADRYAPYRVFSIPSTKEEILVLFMYRNGRYEKVSLLGSFGMSEYQIGGGEIVSAIHPRPIISDVVAQSPKVEEKASTVSQTKLPLFNIETKGKVSDMIDGVLSAKQGSSEALEFFSWIKDNSLIPDIPVVFGTPETHPLLNMANGYYSRTEKQIVLDRVLKSDPTKVANILYSEVVHSVTSDYLNKCVNHDGSRKDPKAILPVAMENLISLFTKAQSTVDSAALKAYQAKRKIILSKDQSQGSNLSITAEEKMTLEPLSDIHEFVEYMFSKEEFRNRMDKISGINGLSLFERFKQILVRIFRSITPNSLADQTITSALEIIKDKPESSNRPNTQELKSEFSPQIEFDDIQSYTTPTDIDMSINNENVNPEDIVTIDIKTNEEKLNEMNKNFEKSGHKSVSLEEFNYLTKEEQTKLFECYG